MATVRLPRIGPDEGFPSLRAADYGITPVIFSRHCSFTKTDGEKLFKIFDQYVAKDRSCLTAIKNFLESSFALEHIDPPKDFIDFDPIAYAPESHKVLAESPTYRLLEVAVEPGHEEKTHSHQWNSLLLILKPVKFETVQIAHNDKIRFYSEDMTPRVVSISSEGPHYMVNQDTEHQYYAIRLECK